jgi:hypothetical protein
MKNSDLVAIDDKKLFSIGLFACNRPRVPLVHTVVFELVDHVFQIHEWIVDCFDSCLRIAHRCAKDKAADAAKAIDTHVDWHCGRRHTTKFPELLPF